MKKVNLLIVFLLTTIVVLGQLKFDYDYFNLDTCQLKCTYQLTYAEDSTNIDKKRTIDMYLFLGKDISLFVSKEKYIADTIMKNIKNQEQFQAFLLQPDKPFARVRYRIYKNYPSGKITFIHHIPSSTFRFEEDLDLLSWQISQDTSTFQGYQVQKATCSFGGRDWIAWFTNDIPYNDGPYKFNGLPGLIVKINDAKYHYNFQLIYIEKPIDTEIIELQDKEYFNCSKFDFFKAKDDFRDDIVNRAKEAGIASEGQRNAARVMSQKNNPIELIRK